MEPWLDEQSIDAGRDWEHEIRSAIRASDAVVVCLSKTATTKRGFLQKEIKYVLDVSDEQPEGRIFVIPVMLEACDVPERLRRWQWIDYSKIDGHERLVRALRARAKEIA